ncbi:MAG: hypothetical protein Q8R15_05270 [Candidatus Micrarchaeota archaeon]|nr:hypothetical protein [Candidatus Micrarchaeota archaeon]
MLMRPFKGQASGPIELVVAVIILVASMGLAFMVLQNTQSAQCTDKLKSQMRGLEAIMLDVALGSPATSREVDIELASCGGTSIEAIRVVYYDSPAYCGKCPASGGGCWIIEPLSYSKDEQEYFTVRDATTCINIPGKVLLKTDDACDASLITTSETNNPGCPPDAKEARQGCGLPPGLTSAQSSKLVTIGKEPGETQYKARVTKDFDTAASDPVIKMCFLSKQDYMRD